MGEAIKKSKYNDYGKEVIEMLNRSAERLLYSFEKVKKFINDKEEFNDEELEIIESMCSRFARTNDILLQKAYRFLDIVEYEGYDFNVPKRIHLAKQRGLIDDEMTFKYIRELRNEVAHNYATDYYIELFKEIYKYTPKLIEYVRKAETYLTKKIIS